MKLLKSITDGAGRKFETGKPVDYQAARFQVKQVAQEGNAVSVLLTNPSTGAEAKQVNFWKPDLKEVVDNSSSKAEAEPETKAEADVESEAEEGKE